MSIVSRTISGLYNGVSQQPAPLRFDTQCDVLENFYPSVGRGLIKRPPLTRVTPPEYTPMPWNGFNHVIEKSTTEKYCLSLGTSGVANQPAGKVINLLTGQKATGSPFSDTFTSATVSQTQVGEDPKTYFAAATAGDYTIVVDKRRVVAMKAVTVDPNVPTAFVYVRSGVVDNSYSVTLNGTVSTYSIGNGAGVSQTTAIATGVTAAINATSGTHGCTAVQTGNNIKITKASDFTFSVSDSYGNTCLVGIKGQIGRYADLPASFYEGYRIKIAGDVGNGRSAYYVHWVSTAGTQVGAWVETTPYGISKELDKVTMPKVFYFDGANFVLVDWDWGQRLVGDNTSCPAPSFVGQTITDVFYWRGRLGFIAGEDVILSRSDDAFNFWPKSATIVADNDPIDLPANSNEVQKFLYAVPHQKALLIFAEKGQFTLTSGEILSPRNAKMELATTYNTSPTCKPVSAGSSIYFAVKQGNNSSIWEYFIQPDGLNYGAEEVTSHVPQYLPNDIDTLVISPTESVLVALSTSQTTTAYVYNYQWSGEEKLQSAWHKWTFPLRARIMGAHFIGSDLYVFNLRTDRNNASSVDKITLRGLANDGTLPYSVHLDLKSQQTGSLVTISGVQYTLYAVSAENELGNQTSLVDASVIELRANMQAILGSEWGTSAGAVLPLEFQSYGGIASQPMVKGDWTAHAVWLGVRYTSRFRFSEQFMKDNKDRAVEGGRLQLKRFAVRYSDTGYFRGEVTVVGRTLESYIMTSRTIGNSALLLGTPRLDSGLFSFPTLSRSTAITIDLVNDTALPSTLHSATWLGDYSTRAQTR